MLKYIVSCAFFLFLNRFMEQHTSRIINAITIALLMTYGFIIADGTIIHSKRATSATEQQHKRLQARSQQRFDLKEDAPRKDQQFLLNRHSRHSAIESLPYFSAQSMLHAKTTFSDRTLSSSKLLHNLELVAPLQSKQFKPLTANIIPTHPSKLTNYANLVHAAKQTHPPKPTRPPKPTNPTHPAHPTIPTRPPKPTHPTTPPKPVHPTKPQHVIEETTTPVPTTTQDPFTEFCEVACEQGMAGPECNCPDHPIG